jgi:hypothetical protein
LLGLGWCNCCFAGDAAIRAVVAPLRVLGLGPEPACRQPWHFRTIVRVSGVSESEGLKAYVFLLLMDMANLEPDVLFVEWPWRISNDVLETLQKNVSERQG